MKVGKVAAIQKPGQELREMGLKREMQPERIRRCKALQRICLNNRPPLKDLRD